MVKIKTLTILIVTKLINKIMYINSRLFLYFQIKTIYLKTFKVTITNNVLAKII